MARIVLNEKRSREAACILGEVPCDTPIDAATIDLVRMAVNCHFESRDCGRLIDMMKKGATDPVRQTILIHLANAQPQSYGSHFSDAR